MLGKDISALVRYMSTFFSPQKCEKDSLYFYLYTYTSFIEIELSKLWSSDNSVYSLAGGYMLTIWIQLSELPKHTGGHGRDKRDRDGGREGRPFEA